MEEKKRRKYASLYENSVEEKPRPAERDSARHGGRNRHRRTMEKVLRRLAFSFLLMAVVLLSAFHYFEMREAKREAVLDYIRQEKKVKEAVAETEKSPGTLAILDQYDVLYKMHPDLAGWIKIEGTAIDYPVMQDKTGEEYYLNHNFEGKEDNEGNPFISSDSSIAPMDKNIVIFGHNMRNGSQFGELDRYLDPDFYQKHTRIIFDTIYETGEYEIVSIVKTQVKKEEEKGFRYYWFHNYETEKEFRELQDFIARGQVYDTGKKLSYGDETLMLSTCEYTVEHGRLVVIAKRIQDKK